MGFNANLPVLVPAVIALIAISVAAGLTLAWNRRPDVRVWVGRAWIAAALVVAAGVVIFWISTAMVQGPHRAGVDRSLQERQQDDLRQRLQKGGH